ncbi:MAG: ADP-ribosylation/crystallin J1 [Chloroflexota bacterium]
MTEIRTLYRPVGLFELRLIRDANYRVFPPRLPHQPIFYPVLNEEYAIQIACDWNSSDVNSGYMGAVTAFDLDMDYLARFEPQIVGSAIHRELWIPSERLNEFNAHIVSAIRITRVFYGDQFSGEKAW